MHRTAALIYPHQLFDPHPAIDGATVAVLVEEPLLFRQYRFHRQKLVLHRASLKAYAAKLAAAGLAVRYLETSDLPTTGVIADHRRNGRSPPPASSTPAMTG